MKYVDIIIYLGFIIVYFCFYFETMELRKGNVRRANKMLDARFMTMIVMVLLIGIAIAIL